MTKNVADMGVTPSSCVGMLSSLPVLRRRRQSIVEGKKTGTESISDADRLAILAAAVQMDGTAVDPH
jgi:hypothetical protein